MNKRKIVFINQAVNFLTVDIVNSFTEKFDDYTDNYIYATKNRYQKINLSELKFNISQSKIMRPEKEFEIITTAPQTVQRLSFVAY